jgi:putative ABC transport system ATP-binding protein
MILEPGGKGGAPARIRAQGLMSELGLEARMSRLSQELSAGEQQRVAIARALANQPDVVLADEPTANLDSAAGQRVMTLLAGLVRRGETKALVVVTHDSRILDFADEVLWMEDGTLRVDADRAGKGVRQAERSGATPRD